MQKYAGRQAQRGQSNTQLVEHVHPLDNPLRLSIRSQSSHLALSTEQNRF
jgi:hypothetical protein